MQIRHFTMDDYPVVMALWQRAGPGVTVRPSDRPEEKVNLLVHRDNEAARRLCRTLGYDEMTSFVAIGKEL